MTVIAVQENKLESCWKAHKNDSASFVLFLPVSSSGISKCISFQILSIVLPVYPKERSHGTSREQNLELSYPQPRVSCHRTVFKSATRTGGSVISLHCFVFPLDADINMLEMWLRTAILEAAGPQQCHRPFSLTPPPLVEWLLRTGWYSNTGPPNITAAAQVQGVFRNDLGERNNRLKKWMRICQAKIPFVFLRDSTFRVGGPLKHERAPRIREPWRLMI